jgi:hypothetical protein
VISELKIRSVAVPPLGCGNGGLELNPIIEAKLATSDDAEIHVFTPDGASARVA